MERKVRRRQTLSALYWQCTVSVTTDKLMPSQSQGHILAYRMLLLLTIHVLQLVKQDAHVHRHSSLLDHLAVIIHPLSWRDSLAFERRWDLSSNKQPPRGAAVIVGGGKQG